jgi:hypothetical protein
MVGLVVERNPENEYYYLIYIINKKKTRNHVCRYNIF